MARDEMEMRVWPTAKAPPVGITTRTVCELLNWTMLALLTQVEKGCLPPPVLVGGELLWDLHYPQKVRTEGYSIPGTYPGLPPGVTIDGELAKWQRREGKINLSYRPVGPRDPRRKRKPKGGGM